MEKRHLDTLGHSRISTATFSLYFSLCPSRLYSHRKSLIIRKRSGEGNRTYIPLGYRRGQLVVEYATVGFRSQEDCGPVSRSCRLTPDFLTLSYNLCQQGANSAPLTATIGLLGRSRSQKSKLTDHSQPSCCGSARLGRKIRTRRSRNPTQAPPVRFGSAFSLILGLGRSRETLLTS